MEDSMMLQTAKPITLNHPDTLTEKKYVNRKQGCKTITNSRLNMSPSRRNCYLGKRACWRIL